MRRVLPGFLVLIVIASVGEVRPEGRPLRVSRYHAHHSIDGIYDGSSAVRLDAVVVEFRFVNPHPIVIVEASDRDGTREWRLELDNRFELAQIGMTANTLVKGDKIAVTGRAARDGSRALYVRRLERPADGFWYEQVGSSPRSSLRTRPTRP
jgi:hypothetical protein